MNIKIITIHAMHNPGSVFQAYALQSFLNQSNNNVDIIDYRPAYFYNEGSKFKFLVKRILYHKAYRSRMKKFNLFISQNMSLTQRFTSLEELKKANLKADFFIAGSDQLWNSDFPCGRDRSFYLEFVNDGKKISYATSVGKKEIDVANEKILKSELPTFDAISVREKSTAEYLTRILKRDVFWVSDPVFLLNKAHYENFISANTPINAPYVMIYLSPANPVLDKIINFYREKGLKIILVGGFTRRCYCDIHINDMGPKDFLNFIYHAEVVVSSSFHATAFSYIFHKSFITILPKSNGERIVSLLEMACLMYRGVEEKLDFNLLEKPINWDYVDEVMMTYIARSKKYLHYALS